MPVPDATASAASFPAYNSGALDEAQATLLHEHMRECYSCKSKLRRLQSPEGNQDPGKRIQGEAAMLQPG